MRTRTIFALLPLLAACAPTARPAATSLATSCSEAVKRARANPDLDVDNVPAPLAYSPPPIRNPIPKGVLKNGRGEVEIAVIVDTLGKADMKTFKVVRTSHPWLANSVRRAVRQWTFEPAHLGGCKVPRLFKFAARSGAAAPTRK